MNLYASLHDQHVVILGGTSGIGLATAQAASSAGARVTIASSSPAKVATALAELPKQARGEAVDLTDPSGVKAFFGTLGELDHLVYTAGETLALMPLAELDLKRAQQAFSLRYFGALSAVHAAAPHLHEGGSITLTSGDAGLRPSAGWSVAASICGAVFALTRALAVELAPIRVNAVAPGVIRSPLWAGMSEADRQQMYDAVGTANLVGRVGEPEDAAHSYLYCMTQRFTTGTVVDVNGGSLLA